MSVGEGAGYLGSESETGARKKMKKVTVPSLHKMKERGDKIAALTAYDATFAALEDAAGIDVILVGDSAANVIAGEKTTLGITLDEMVFLSRYVSRGVKRAMLVADMPFGVAQISTEDLLRAAVRFMKEGNAEAVKIEGASYNLPAIERLAAMGVPVMGHLGLTPQSVHVFGGYGLRGKGEAEAKRIVEDAKRLQDAGVFSLVLEKVPAALAKSITEELTIPTIGIGSGVDCDGQILVNYDLLGMGGMKLKFVRRYLEGGELITDAVRRYVDDIRGGSFPNDEESF